MLRDLAYREGGSSAHLLDIYRPDSGSRPLPVVFYVHGGGFRILSKDTHWLMGLLFARHGYLVVNVNYRLAPTYPFPAAVEDVCDAWSWTLDHVAAFGGDPQRLVLAGESAGGNLILALTLCLCSARTEPFAERLQRGAVLPRAVWSACGLLQASDVERFYVPGTWPRWLLDHLVEISAAYLPPDQDRPRYELDLADPLVALERGVSLTRPLPPVLLTAGTADPLVDDTRRLERELGRRKSPFVARYYEGERHAFHAFYYRRQAKQCWRDAFAFLADHVPGATVK